MTEVPPPPTAGGVPEEPSPLPWAEQGGAAPPGSPLPGEGRVQPAGFAAGPAVPGVPAPPPRGRRRTGLIIGIAAALVVLAGAGIGVVVAHRSGAGSLRLPDTLLGLRKYDGPGAQRMDTGLASDLAASRGLVRPVAAYYGDPSGSGRWIAVADGGRCTSFCGPRSAQTAMFLALALGIAGTRPFPPGPDGGVLVCGSLASKDDTACVWFSRATTGFAAYPAGLASSPADAAALTRLVRAAIEHPGRRQPSAVGSPGGSLVGSLNAVSCASPGFCMAAGSYNPGAYAQTVTEAWKGASWSRVSSPGPGRVQSVYLTGVSCAGPGFCMAVGLYQGGTGYQTLALRWNGARWALLGSPDPGTQGNGFNAVSCTSASFCMAVGAYFAGGRALALTARWNGAGWIRVPSPDAGAAGSSRLRGVSCSTARFCMAVGYHAGPGDQTLTETWDGTRWTMVRSPNASAQPSYLYAVSCPTTRFCMAVGYYYTGPADQTLTETWDGVRWALAPSPDTSRIQGNGFNAVSCPSTTFCMAAGSYNPGPQTQTLTATWNGASWTLVSSPSPGSTLDAVSCPTTTACMATGEYNASTGQILAENWNGTRWQAIPTPHR